MTKVLAYRLLQFPVILAIIYLVTFLLIWVAPGTPFASENRALSPEALQQLRERFNAESPWTFLTYYPWRILTEFDFGPSLVKRGFSVNELIGAGIPISMTLGFVALAIAVVVGMLVGTLSAVKRDGIIDYAGMTLTLVGISVPAFVTAAVLLLVFVAWLEWFPIGRWGRVQDVILPAIALSLAPMAYIVRLQRVSMLDVLGADFVRTARAKGLSKTRVVIKHCMRNAFLPVLSYLGPAAATTLTGSFVIERVFSIQGGLGQHFVDAVTGRDQTMVLGLVLVYSTLLLAMNLVVDMLYAVVDPRIDLEKKNA